jgi:hypothetical protein
MVVYDIVTLLSRFDSTGVLSIQAGRRGYGKSGLRGPVRQS